MHSGHTPRKEKKMKKGIRWLLGLALGVMVATGCNQQMKSENDQLKATNESLTTQVNDLQAKVDEATRLVTEATQQRDACQAEPAALNAAAPGPAGGGTGA